MNLSFLLSEMTFLKYYAPLIEESNKRGFKSNLIIFKSGKYNCPYVRNHIDVLKNFSNVNGVNLIEAREQNSLKQDVIFTVEGTKIDSVSKVDIVSLCCSTDFNALYERYVEKVKHVVMSSEFVATHYGKLNKKNAYLGTPKFDVKIDSSAVKEKYELTSKKYVTIFYPRHRDLSSAPLKKIVSDLRRLDYGVIFKTRGKDPVSFDDKTLVDRSFEDLSWHPHTSLELIKVSDFVINFSSSVIEETTAYQVPLINFHIKPFAKPFNFLYDYSFVENLKVDYSFEDLTKSIERLTTTNFSKEFTKANEKMFDTKTSSKDIFDKII